MKDATAYLFTTIAWVIVSIFMLILTCINIYNKNIFALIITVIAFVMDSINAYNCYKKYKLFK